MINNPFSNLKWILVGILLIFMLIFVIVSVLQMRPWQKPISSRERWKRSMLTGISVMVFVFSLLTMMDLTKSADALNKWSISSLLMLICFLIPLGAIAVIGSYFGFGILDGLRRKGLDFIRDKTYQGK
jgi:cytochrome bd-type quinol oxidase subunit 2